MQQNSTGELSLQREIWQNASLPPLSLGDLQTSSGAGMAEGA